MIHYASFRYCGENFIAIGEQEYRLSVYVENSPGQYARHGRTLWPSWSKFMDGGEVEDYEEGSVNHIDDLHARYRAVARKHDETTRRAMARFSDNPFGPAHPSPEQLEWYGKRDEALRLYRESGDDSLAIEIGLFLSREGETTLAGDGQTEESTEGDGMTLQKMIMGINEHDFEFTRASPDSAVVELLCDEHDHEEYIVGRIECQKGWGVGRMEEGYPHNGDTFWEAVEHCAKELSEECVSLKAIEEVDEFFKNDAIPNLKDRLDALAAFLPVFEAPDFRFGRMTSPPGNMPFYAHSEEASRFIEICYDMKWMKSFDWAEWNRTPEAISLRDDPSSLEEATHEQLERLLTALIRQDRFVEGLLGDAAESGLLIRILRRAATLSDIQLVMQERDATEDTTGWEPFFDLHDEELRERFGLPEGYLVWLAEPTATFCTFDADNPGSDVTAYEVLTPITRADGGRIRVRVVESVRHGSPPSDAEYFLQDEGDTEDYILTSGTELNDTLKARVEELLSDTESVLTLKRSLWSYLSSVVADLLENPLAIW